MKCWWLEVNGVGCSYEKSSTNQEVRTMGMKKGAQPEIFVSSDISCILLLCCGKQLTFVLLSLKGFQPVWKVWEVFKDWNISFQNISFHTGEVQSWVFNLVKTRRSYFTVKICLLLGFLVSVLLRRSAQSQLQQRRVKMPSLIKLLFQLACLTSHIIF